MTTSMLLTLGCKKSGPNPAPNPSGTAACQLSFWKATETANPFSFAYTSQGKIAKSKVFTNGNSQPPTVIVFEYDAQNRLVKTYDSLGVALNNEFTETTVYSAHNAAGYPLKALRKFTNTNRRLAELDFVYNGKNNVVKAVMQFFDLNDKLYSKDTVNFYYDSNENFVKGTANTRLNGTRGEYAGIELEDYDSKPSFYGSLGVEFNLQRVAASGDAYAAAGYYGYYLYSPSAHNPGKVYLHNQGLDNRGDYLTYSYEYDAATGYPTKISFTNTSGGVTRGPGFAEARYACK